MDLNDLNKPMPPPEAKDNKTNEYVSIKEKTKRNIHEFLQSSGNYAIIGILVIVSVLFSFVKFDNGTILLNIPNYGDNWLGWIVFIAMTLFPVIIGVLIKNSLRKQGLYLAINSPNIRKLQNEYDSLLTVETLGDSKPPRSLEKYKRSTLLKELGTNIVLAIIMTLFSIGVSLSAGWEGLGKQAINLLLWGAVGIMNMFNANDYVLTEYKQWLEIHIKELKDNTTDPKGA